MRLREGFTRARQHILAKLQASEQLLEQPRRLSLIDKVVHGDRNLTSGPILAKNEDDLIIRRIQLHLRRCARRSQGADAHLPPALPQVCRRRSSPRNLKVAPTQLYHDGALIALLRTIRKGGAG